MMLSAFRGKQNSNQFYYHHYQRRCDNDDNYYNHYFCFSSHAPLAHCTFGQALASTST